MKPLPNRLFAPIDLTYRDVSEEFVAELRCGGEMCEIPSHPAIKIGNAYRELGFPGTQDRVFARSAVVRRIERIADALLDSGIGLYVFDAFRSFETQKALFQKVTREIYSRNPSASSQEVRVLARTFASDPDEKLSPHNTGGAIDCALYDLETGELWDFGADFDEPSDISSTLFFEKEFDPGCGFSQERWELCRRNRRVLFHLFVEQGFTNYENEWWHFDLGDSLWAERLGVAEVFEAVGSR